SGAGGKADAGALSAEALAAGALARGRLAKGAGGVGAASKAKGPGAMLLPCKPSNVSRSFDDASSAGLVLVTAVTTTLVFFARSSCAGFGGGVPSAGAGACGAALRGFGGAIIERAGESAG